MNQISWRVVAVRAFFVIAFNLYDYFERKRERIEKMDDDLVKRVKRITGDSCGLTLFREAMREREKEPNGKKIDSVQLCHDLRDYQIHGLIPDYVRNHCDEVMRKHIRVPNIVKKV